MGGLGHRLHAPGDHDLDLAGADQLVGHRDRVDARQAHLVDGDARDGHRDAAGDCGGAGGVLAGTGLDDLAHDHVVDLVARDARLLQGAGDGDAAEVGGRLVLEPSEQPADRRTGAGDDDGSGHGCLLGSAACSSGNSSATIPTPCCGGRGRVTALRVRKTSQAVATARPPQHDGGMALPTHLFTAIDHVGIAVADLDEAIAFYRDTFGMEIVHEETNEEQGVREAMVAVGDVRTLHPAARPAVPDSTIAKFLDRSGPGMQQLAYRVEDVEAVSAVLRERGLRLLYDEPRRGTSGSRVNFVHPKDAGGVLVELVEPPT